MIIILESDIVLDLLLDRKPYSQEASQIFSLVERGVASGYICAFSLLSVHKEISKTSGESAARKVTRKLLSFIEVAPLNRAILEAALPANAPDFEKRLTSAVARSIGARAIVTRAVQEYQGSRVNAYLPIEIIGILSSNR